jgi:hypothetical protein
VPNFVPLPCSLCGSEPGSPGDGGGGGCPNGSATVVRLCDISAEDCVPFLRHIAYSCEGVPTGYTDTSPDGVTPYEPQGTAGDCADCFAEEESPVESPCEASCEKALILCDCLPDGTTHQFLRRITIDCVTGEITEITDWETNGIEPYKPVGEIVEDCEECACKRSTCARLAGISGPDTWSLPDGVDSLNISVVCPPVTVTDCTGEPTVINECGNLNWTAPATSTCEVRPLCTPFVVDIPDGSAVYIQWTEPCVSEES